MPPFPCFLRPSVSSFLPSCESSSCLPACPTSLCQAMIGPRTEWLQCLGSLNAKLLLQNNWTLHLIIAFNISRKTNSFLWLLWLFLVVHDFTERRKKERKKENNNNWKRSITCFGSSTIKTEGNKITVFWFLVEGGNKCKCGCAKGKAMEWNGC